MKARGQHRGDDHRQNHGFAVDEQHTCIPARHPRLPVRWHLAGHHRTDQPAFGFQGHPKPARAARCRAVFDRFLELIKQYRKTAK
ncbi:hypothetical protein ACLK12_00170 [Escherichia coli]